MRVTLFAALMALGFSSNCDSDTPNRDAADTSTTADIAETSPDLTSPETTSGGFTQSGEASTCGGFAAALTAAEPTPDYCAAERLEWQYDAAGHELILSDNRVPLNCCGTRSMAAEQGASGYVVVEMDEPDPVEGRCRCMCVFDYRMTMTGIPAGTISLQIKRAITEEENGPLVIWQGDLDLTAGNGSIVIDDQPLASGCSTEGE